MATGSKGRRRTRGEIEALPSGSLRVRVYAGLDPLTKKRHYLVETVPAGPGAAREAEKLRTRLLAEVDQQRNPRTRATVNQLLDRYLELLDIEETTRRAYEANIRTHIRPLLGTLPLTRLNGEVLDAFYATLRRCREHCDGRRHDGHVCKPLAASAVRKNHTILSGACERAVKWRWLGVNPTKQASAPPLAPANPRPPTAEEAAAILNEAWKDPDWGMFVWLAMVTGARRGELCALAWDRLDLEAGVLVIRTSIAQRGGRTWEKETKTHQQRRLTLDEQTVALLSAYRDRCRERAEAVGIELPADARIFSLDPDGSTWPKPDSMTQRYARMCVRLGWDMHLHQLRHYSATELIAGGVDVRTVAGRLGHGGGGATTLKVYSAWRSEADQRAAGSLASRMPVLPVTFDQDGKATIPGPRAADESAPYQRIAADLRAAIACGALRPGDQLPRLSELAERYGVAESTVHRAISELSTEGLLESSPGQRINVAPHHLAGLAGRGSRSPGSSASPSKAASWWVDGTRDALVPRKNDKR